MLFLFFFKQKTAYEMRISDWSSDVCSSDLAGTHQLGITALATGEKQRQMRALRDELGQLKMTGQHFTAASGFQHQLRMYQRHVPGRRSEEPTSELQSLMRIPYAVFCLKKKKKQHNNISKPLTKIYIN